MSLPRSASGWTMAVFGVLAVLTGVIGLVVPAVLLEILGFTLVEAGERASTDYTVTFMAASSMASLNMGVYYLVAVVHDWQPFFRFTVAFRLLTFTVFTVLVITEVAPARFFGVALWEGVGAVVTGIALWWEARGTMIRRPADVPSKP